MSNETGAVRPISDPDTEINGDSSPALSADAGSLAFVRNLAPRNGRILIQPLGPGFAPRGEPEEVPNSRLAVHSPVWLDGGKNLLFADEVKIFHWDAKKGTTAIYAVDGILGGMSVGPDRGNSRHAVVARAKVDPDIWEIPLDATGTRSTGPAEVLVRSTERDTLPDLSPDGRHIVFTSMRTGTSEIWVCDADGSNLRQLTHLGAHIVRRTQLATPGGDHLSGSSVIVTIPLLDLTSSYE